jgi:hypothetical protein
MVLNAIVSGSSYDGIEGNFEVRLFAFSGDPMRIDNISVERSIVFERESIELDNITPRICRFGCQSMFEQYQNSACSPGISGDGGIACML